MKYHILFYKGNTLSKIFFLFAFEFALLEQIGERPASWFFVYLYKPFTSIKLVWFEKAKKRYAIIFQVQETYIASYNYSEKNGKEKKLLE